MSQPDVVEHTHHRKTHWGPVTRLQHGLGAEAGVGDEHVEIKLPYRSPAQRNAGPTPQPFKEGVPVLWNGEQVATVRDTRPSRSGLGRRARFEVVGDARFVLPGMSFSERTLPEMLTLSYDGGALVATQRWAAPLNVIGTEFLSFWDAPIPPRVPRGTRPEHIALWFAMRSIQR